MDSPQDTEQRVQEMAGKKKKTGEQTWLLTASSADLNFPGVPAVSLATAGDDVIARQPPSRSMPAEPKILDVQRPESFSNREESTAMVMPSKTATRSMVEDDEKENLLAL